MHTLLNRTALLALCLLFAKYSNGQNAEVSEAAQRYKGENAITWEHKENLHLQFENGKLIGKSEVSREVLLLTDRAASMHNTDEVYHGFQHALTSIEAASMVPSGSKYKTVRATEFKTTHSKEENIFYNDTKETEVTFSNLVRFARTKLDYTVVHHDVHFLTPFYFQSHIPQRSASYSVTMPKGVVIGYKLNGLHTDKVKMTKEEGRNEITYTWTATDLPSFKRYDNAPAYAYSIPHVVVYVKSYEDPRSGAKVSVLSSVDDLYHWYYGFIKNVDSKPDAEMTAIVDSLTKDVSSQKVKAARIYKWVQDHLRYVAYEDSLGGYIPRNAALVCLRRFGDCKDMTSVLVAMSRKAGLDAHFAWIGTRDIPYKYEELPTPMNDNHMICMTRIDGKWVYMDGTDRSILFGMPPYHIQGKEALVSIDAKSFEIVNVPIAGPEKNVTVDTTTLSLTGDDVQGEIAAHYSGYPAWYHSALMMYSSGTDRDKFLRRMTKRGSERFTQESADFKTLSDDAKDCKIAARFSLPGYVHHTGSELYLNLNLQRDYDDDYVDQAQREAPLEYSYRQQRRQVVSLKIPAGYKATYLPPDKADGDPQLWSYKLHYEQKGDRVFLIKDITLNTLLVTPDKFSVHNRLVEGLRDEYKESVVLSKIN
jgi:transglutaminase-like putative cysteine protease